MKGIDIQVNKIDSLEEFCGSANSIDLKEVSCGQYRIKGDSFYLFLIFTYP